MMQQEPTAYDLAYRGRTAAVKILLNENEKLKTQTDSVRIVEQRRGCIRKLHLNLIITVQKF